MFTIEHVTFMRFISSLVAFFSLSLFALCVYERFKFSYTHSLSKTIVTLVLGLIIGPISLIFAVSTTIFPDLVGVNTASIISLAYFVWIIIIMTIWRLVERRFEKKYGSIW